MKFRRFLCRLLGHNWKYIVTGSNREACLGASGSTWGWRSCSRCDKEEPFQYDG